VKTRKRTRGLGRCARPNVPPGAAGYLSQETRIDLLQATSAALDAITGFKQQFLQVTAPADNGGD